MTTHVQLDDRMTGPQCVELINAPGMDTLKGLRDSAIIAMLLCAGLRELELCHLDIPDLEVKTAEGQLGVMVKGSRQRIVQYGHLDFALLIVKKWLNHACITTGPVFRGFYKGSKRLRPDRLSVRAIEYILAAYPLTVDGKLVHIKPHDCRRTYARLLYDDGMQITAIQQQLGLADTKMTEQYIGIQGCVRREPTKVIPFDVAQVITIPNRLI